MRKKSAVAIVVVLLIVFVAFILVIQYNARKDAVNNDYELFTLEQETMAQEEASTEESKSTYEERMNERRDIVNNAGITYNADMMSDASNYDMSVQQVFEFNPSDADTLNSILTQVALRDNLNLSDFKTDSNPELVEWDGKFDYYVFSAKDRTYKIAAYWDGSGAIGYLVE